LEDDYPIRVWAGVVPLRAQAEEPVADPHLLPGIPVVDKGRIDRAYGFASRTTMLADVRFNCPLTGRNGKPPGPYRLWSLPIT